MTSKSLVLLAVLICSCGASEPGEKPAYDPVMTAAPLVAPLIVRRCGLPVSGAWNTFQGDATRRGSVSAPAIAVPKVRWSSRVGILGVENSPAVVSDWVFVGSKGSRRHRKDEADGIYALNAADGSIRWFHPTQADANGLVYTDCLVIAGSDDGVVRALDAATGEAVWQRVFQERRVKAQPIVVGRLVIWGDDQGGVHAFEVGSGRDVWSADAKGPILGGFAADGKRVFTATTQNLAIAFDIASGEVAWRQELHGPSRGVPTVVGDRVIQGFQMDSQKRGLGWVALDAANGEPLWAASNPRGLNMGRGGVDTSIAVRSNLAIYAPANSNRVVAVSLADGKAIWSTVVGDCMKHQLASGVVTSSTVVIARHDGSLSAVNSETGKQRWSISLNRHADAGGPVGLRLWSGCRDFPSEGEPLESTPALGADGTIYVGSAEGYLYAVGEQP